MRKREFCDCGTKLEMHQQLYCSSHCNTTAYYKKKKFEKNLTDFLRESNAIEGVYDDESLLDAREAWEYLLTHRVISTQVVLETHRILMRSQKLEREYIGHFRDIPVYVGGHEGMQVKNIPYAIQRWCFDMNNMSFPAWQNLHVRYENIHPFVDGNGRTGRLFMNWFRLVKHGEPVLIIRASERYDYYDWFRENRGII